MKRVFSTLVILIIFFYLFHSLRLKTYIKAAPQEPDFQETTVLSGLVNPTVVRFSPDGRIFVAEKRGVIKVFDGLLDTTPDVFADLRTNVYNFWDRGLLGLALSPNFPQDPYVFVLYTYDAPVGGTAPFWGTPNSDSDPCPNPPGPTGDGCVVSGRLSKLRANGNVMESEEVLINDWCQQYPSHSIGSLAFGTDGALYVSGGDGASFTFTDFGQDGNPPNPCGDPPGGTGADLTPPTAEGGALRSQDLRTTADPTTLDGAILRVDPATGEALPDNPLFGSNDPNAKRIVAYGLRNPFRITTRPGTNEVWIGDVGWGDWEEINLVANPTDTFIENFGWPCYEGRNRQSAYDGANLNICENFYTEDTDTEPYYTYHHNDHVVPADPCPTGSSSLAGVVFQFYSGSAYPSEYDGSLFFADYSRNCIWVMFKGLDGKPNPANIRTFIAPAASPVDLTVSPAGELYYADFNGGTIRRIIYTSPLTPTPTASPTPPPTGCPTDQFEAEYFSNMTLTGAPVLTRCEATIANNWGPGGPGNGISNDQFSVRWTGNHAFSGGNYTFTARADDGIRAFIDSTQIIDGWQDQPATTYAHTRDLTAGNHDIVVEYYENSGDAEAQFGWSLNSQGSYPCPVDQFYASYFNNILLSGTPVFTRCESFINNDWGSGGPGNGVNTDSFSVRWIGLHGFASGSHTFTALADDGIRAYVDGLQIIDGWRDQAPTQYQSTQNMTSGNHEVKVEYYENGGGAVAQFSWPPTNPPVNDPPVAIIDLPSDTTTWKVGDNISFSGSATDPQDGNLAASALTWDLIMHHCPSNCHTHNIQTFAGVSSGSFSAPDHEYPSYLELRLTAVDSGGLQDTKSVTLNPQTVNLQFSTTPVAGLQLVVGSLSSATLFTRTVIANSNNSVSAPSPQTLNGLTYEFASWSDAGAQTHNITAPTTDTTYTANFNQTTGGGSGDGLKGQYYNKKNLAQPKLTRVDPSIDFSWGLGSPYTSINADTFSVRWSGYVVPTATETYTFYTNTDDGVRLWVNNNLLIDKWVDQALTEWSGNISLNAGQKYSIKMEYYENTSNATAKLLWSSASTPKQIIPQSQLFSQ